MNETWLTVVYTPTSGGATGFHSSDLARPRHGPKPKKVARTELSRHRLGEEPQWERVPELDGTGSPDHGSLFWWFRGPSSPSLLHGFQWGGGGREPITQDDAFSSPGRIQRPVGVHSL